MNQRVYETVARKRACEGPLEPAEAEVERLIGSKGWHTRGYLPHYDKPGTLQMLTFRLADAMPASRRHEWAALFQIEDDRQRQTKLEAYLDRGYGACVFKDPRAAAALEEVVLRFDGVRYRLAAWVVMPNHFHLLVELWTTPMPQLIKAWKGVSANTVNRILGRKGELWQEDYWDRYIRDEEHFRKARRYIESNPVKAGLAKLAEEWPFTSANAKWRWSGSNRYHAAQLVHPSGPRMPEHGPNWTAAGSGERSGERSADIPVRPARRRGRYEADKNVRAPMRAPAETGRMIL